MVHFEKRHFSEINCKIAGEEGEGGVRGGEYEEKVREGERDMENKRELGRGGRLQHVEHAGCHKIQLTRV
ncbi:hypothetical protein [Paenibacillus whitsoniae]|uniref:Uncharacterized protein n=1 Tax=Paenibacillus whitsoniae TaxID=2496558 RepID=A0A3S0A1Z6_9BACL|nr:hypothetical protein [Paenibacillus whitsoniae]RTE07157.1 hypothetical protein EJQ19_21635 [Paenibacillus whitsoniae]